MPERINLGYAERLGLRRMIDARIREQQAGTQAPHIRKGLLHGSALPWPPIVSRRQPEVNPLPSLDFYDRVMR